MENIELNVLTTNSRNELEYVKMYGWEPLERFPYIEQDEVGASWNGDY